MMSTLTFIIVLSILIVVHELGHMIMAKRCGVRVERFALGFGPKLFSRIAGGTEYALCLFPLGGYVKMAGDERSNLKGGKDEYYSQSPGHRALIVVMGPVVNFFLAFFCFWLVFMIGYPTVPAKVGSTLAGYPAQSAGLKSGDQILAIDGQSVKSWEDVQQFITTSQREKLRFSILRDQAPLSLTIVPRTEVLENLFGQKESLRLIGIQPSEDAIFIKFSMGESFLRAAVKLKEITGMTYKAIYRMLTRSMPAAENMTGPIGIFFILQKAATLGFSYLLFLVGIISANLAIFNLLPFPVLDGGHLALLGVERLRGKSLPEKADEWMTKVGLSLIGCLAVFVFYADFKRYGLWDKIVQLWHHFKL